MDAANRRKSQLRLILVLGGQEREASMRKPLDAFRKVLRCGLAHLRRDPDRFLWRVNGVLHVGANIGEEARRYNALGLNVLWVEPIPEVFGRLQANIAPYSNQRALQALLTDKNGAHYTFHIANNDGASSSILELHLHIDIWPMVTYDRSISLESATLCSLASDHGLDLSLYPALVIDTQGSELLVLRGAEAILHNFKYIKTEVADFESYVDCCQLQELKAWLFTRGYREFSRKAFATHPNGGHYYDVVFRRGA